MEANKKHIVTDSDSESGSDNDEYEKLQLKMDKLLVKMNKKNNKIKSGSL